MEVFLRKKSSPTWWVKKENFTHLTSKEKKENNFAHLMSKKTKLYPPNTIVKTT